MRSFATTSASSFSSNYTSSSSSKYYSSASSYNRRSSPSTGRSSHSNIPRNSKEYRPTLSAEQERVLNLVVNERQSVFFTGSAGTGKSVLLRAIIDRLRDRYGTDVAITASTGIAACNINGCTLHSFSGIGLGKEKPEILVEKVQQNKKKKERWVKTKVLIIDEISMVDGELFDKIEYIARAIRQNSAPFGGLQVVITGDFFQLPPVSPNSKSVFAFEAQTWKSVIKRTVMLKQVFRQKDETFVKILNEMRVGRLSEEAIQIFKSLSRLPETHSKIMPTELYPLRRNVEASNQSRLNGLPGEPRMFKAFDSGDQRRSDYFIAPEKLSLKVNAQVMLLKNYDQNLVNGSLGIVKGFAGEGAYTNPNKLRNLLSPKYQQQEREEPDMEALMARGLPIVEFANGRQMMVETETWSFELPGGEIVASRTQIPLMLAWAMSIHKSQGQTLDSVRVDLGETFEKGQAYVALSRATSLESLQILNFHPHKVMAHSKVAEFYRSLEGV